MPAIPSGARSANAAPGAPPSIGNRAYGRLRDAARAAPRAERRDSLEALWHEASRTGSRTAATRLAARAVTGARPGGLPHADRITAATGGKVDGRQFEATTTPGLPALGVTYGGRIAVRPDAPPSVAFHEAAHALGADEHTADRAERDPSLLGTLDKGAPVDGWKIGFELQTVGRRNMKVYEIDKEENDSTGQKTAYLYPDTRHGRKLDVTGVAAPSKGGDAELDMGDVELKTGAYDETKQGRKDLNADVKDLVAWVSNVKAAARTERVSKYGASKARYARQKQKYDKTKKLTDPEWELPKPTIPWNVKGVRGTVGGKDVMVTNFDSVRASIQATMGISLTKLGDYVRHKATSGTRVGFETRSDSTPLLSLGYRGGSQETVQDNANDMINKLDEWVTLNKPRDDDLTQLFGVLSLLAFTFAKCLWRAKQKKAATLTKDDISLMHRTNLAAVYKKLTVKEKIALSNIAVSPGDAYGPTYRGAQPIDRRYPDVTFDHVVREFAAGRDALATLEGQSQVGVLEHDRSTVESKLPDRDKMTKTEADYWSAQHWDLNHFHVDEPTEIGRSWGSGDVRKKGMIIEDRLVGASANSPVDKWPDIIDAYFRSLVYISNGVILGDDLDDDGTTL